MRPSFTSMGSSSRYRNFEPLTPATPATPKSPKTPHILNCDERGKTDQLRAQFAQLIDDFQPSFKTNVESLVDSFKQECGFEDVWYAALTSRFYAQDLPLVECGIRNYHSLIEAFLTRSPLSEGMRQRVLEAVGQYGQTALQHAISAESWQAASMLVRHGANCGLEGDSLGVVKALKDAAYNQRAQRRSWRKVDQKLLDLFSTITMIYGGAWNAASADKTTERSKSEHFDSGHNTTSSFDRELSVSYSDLSKVSKEESYTPLPLASAANLKQKWTIRARSSVKSNNLANPNFSTRRAKQF